MLSSITRETVQNFEIPCEWIYRGEGNCNVVVSLPKSKKILRIRKIDRPKTLIEWFIIWISDFLYWYCGKNIKEELRDLKFYSLIMRPLIGIKYTCEANQVILKRRQVSILENELNKYRPESRKMKILQYDRAALFDDFAFLSENEHGYLSFKVTDSTFAVEIKPKQGWRRFNERHFPKCVFCMNQYLKMEKRQIKEFSKYCPEDLFSGNAERMKVAINSLIEVPQNNFRIFKNGILWYGEATKTLFNEILPELFETSDEPDRLQEEFCNLIQQCLTKNLCSTNIIGNCIGKVCESDEIIKNKTIATNLPNGCVLHQILSVQMLDKEEDNKYNKLLNIRIEDWKYVNLLLNKIDSRISCLKCAIMTLSSANKDEKDSDLNFVPYMISSIAKDCSLMITLRKIKENISDEMGMNNIIKTSYGYYLLNIGVFDLYPKPLSTIKKHCKRNQDIFRAYMKATGKADTVKTHTNIAKIRKSSSWFYKKPSF